MSEMAITASPLCWPPQWPRNEWPVSGRFRTTVAEAREKIIRELGLMGAEGIIISSNAEVDRYGQIRFRQKRLLDTGVAVYFTLDGEQMVMPCDRFELLEENMQAIALSLEAIRGLERWGTHQFMRAAFSGFKALPAGRPWWEVLGVAEHADDMSVRIAYRARIKQVHPDVPGGDRDAFEEVARAYRTWEVARTGRGGV